MSEPRPSPPNPSPRGRGKGEGRGSIPRGEQPRSLRSSIIALVALVAWYALRLLPGDITPEAPETALRQAVLRGVAPQRLWREPQPSPSYDPTIAYSLLDHLDQATISHRGPPDADILRRDLGHLRDQLSSRWLSTSGDWRVAGEGVLTCFGAPAQSDRLAAALRPASGQVARVSARVRFLTPPQPQERAGLTLGLDSQGFGLAFLVGWSGRGTLTCDWVRLNEYRVAQVLTHEEVGVANPGGDQLTSWLAVALTSAAEGAGGTHGGWQATINGRPLSAAPATALPSGHPGVLLQSQGTRVAFADFSLDDSPTDSDLAESLARLTESLRLADLLVLPGDPNFQFRLVEPGDAGSFENQPQSGGPSSQAPAGQKKLSLPQGGNLVQQVEIAGVARPALVAPAPSTADFPLPQLSGPCRLQAWVGLHPAGWQQSGAFARPDLPRTEVRVRVTLRTPAGERELWSRTLGPDPSSGESWTRVDVALPAFASWRTPGLSVSRRIGTAPPSTLSLRAEGIHTRTEVPGGYVVWANPIIRLPQARTAPGNVILVIIDSLRADAFESANQTRARTATLDRLAGESVSFENAFAQSPWGVPSLATLYSSLWPEVHGADPPDFRTPGSLSPAAVTLAEALRHAGYQTTLVSDEPYPERVNLEQGFEEVISARAMGAAQPPALFGRAARHAGEEVEKPFFLCVHTHHLTHTVAEVLLEPPMNLDRLREKLHARYISELEVVDQALGDFLGALQSHGLLKDSLVIVTSDHGTDLSDRYPTIIPAGAGFTLHDEQLHVPLLLRAPAGLLKPRRVAGQVRLIDLAPTVCDLLGLTSPTDWQGESLAPQLREGADVADRPVFAAACNLKPERAAVRWRGYKYVRVLNPQEPRGEPFLEPLDDEQLYNVSKNPGETKNLAAKAPGLLTEMRTLLLTHLEEGVRRRQALFPEGAPQLVTSSVESAEGAPSAEAEMKAPPAPAVKAGESTGPRPSADGHPPQRPSGPTTGGPESPPP